jgi:hypothetical protein
VIHWMNPYDNCHACGYDLDGHAFRQAIADSEREAGPDLPSHRVIFYWWPKTLRPVRGVTSRCPHRNRCLKLRAQRTSTDRNRLGSASASAVNSTAPRMTTCRTEEGSG